MGKGTGISHVWEITVEKSQTSKKPPTYVVADSAIAALAAFIRAGYSAESVREVGSLARNVMVDENCGLVIQRPAKGPEDVEPVAERGSITTERLSTYFGGVSLPVNPTAVLYNSGE